MRSHQDLEKLASRYAVESAVRWIPRKSLKQLLPPLASMGHSATCKEDPATGAKILV